jgi:phosphatidylglycerol:prolipoprotein diacylglycerol transferase
VNKLTTWYYSIMPILFHLPGDLPVYTSSIVIGLGGTIGLALIAWRSPKEYRTRFLDAGLLALLGALIFGRLGFVLANWSYFKQNFFEILLIYLGGFSWVSALLGILLSLAITAAIFQHPFSILVDATLPLLGALSVSAWLACWLDGCAYGATTDAWWGLPAKDEWGIIAPRAPLQLSGAMLSAGLIGILIWGVARRATPGITAYIGFFSLAAITLLLSFFRADPSQRWQGLSYDSWAAIILMGISGLALLAALAKRILKQPINHNQGETEQSQPE